MEDDGDNLTFIPGNDQYPIYCAGAQLSFTIVKSRDAEERKWSQKQVQAIRPQDVESDYESVDSELDDSKKVLRLDQVSCGVWDSSGHYLDAWRRRCDPDQDTIIVNEDKGRLSLGTSSGIIRINLYTIKYTIADEDWPYYYLVLRSVPTFIIEEQE